MPMKNIIITILTLASLQAYGQKKDQALAFCWQNKEGMWWCDGPLQILWSGQEKLEKALVKVGCDEYKKSRPWAGNRRIGHLFVCNQKLKEYDRDIRERYGL